MLAKAGGKQAAQKAAATPKRCLDLIFRTLISLKPNRLQYHEDNGVPCGRTAGESRAFLDY